MSVAAVILAAGTGSRMRAESEQTNKLLCRLGDETLLRRCWRIVSSAGYAPIVVVLGHEAERLRPELAGTDAQVVLNPRYADGQSTSVARGVEALDGVADLEGALFVPADQPGLDAQTLERLAERFRTPGKTIAAPRWRGRRGAPVLFGRRHFESLRSLEGDAGGRQLLSENEPEIAWLELEDDLPLLDADTPSALRAVAERLGCEARLGSAAS